MVKLLVAVEGSPDGSTFHHVEPEQHCQHIVTLSQQYVVTCVNHFNPEEVIKGPQMLHLKGHQQLGFDIVDFGQVGPCDDQVIHIQQNAYRASSTFSDKLGGIKLRGLKPYFMQILRNL